jgi:hypothetical protein
MTQADIKYTDRSLGELLSQIGNDSSTLLQQEIALARAEMSEKAKAAGAGIGVAVVALVLLLAALGAGVTAAIAALRYVLPTWAAALCVLGGLVLLAGLLGFIASRMLRAASPPIPTRAVTVAKETPHELVS